MFGERYVRIDITANTYSKRFWVLFSCFNLYNRTVMSMSCRMVNINIEFNKFCVIFIALFLIQLLKRYIQSCIVPSAIRTNQHNNANKELIDTNIHTRLKLFPSCWMNTHISFVLGVQNVLLKIDVSGTMNISFNSQ